MARITVEDCLSRVNNRFALVLLVSKRAKQLMKGSKSTVAGKDNKTIVTALREVASGSVRYDLDDWSEMMAEVEKDLMRVSADFGREKPVPDKPVLPNGEGEIPTPQ